MSTSTSLYAYIGYERHYSFRVFGVAVQRNQVGSNNSRHTGSIHKGLNAGKRPDLMTSKPDANSTLGYHWTDCGAIAQWSFSGNPVLICIIGTHWKTTVATSTLRCQWNHTGWCQHPMVPQWQSRVNLHIWNTLEHHRKTTGRTLETHWLPTIFLQWHSNEHWGLSSKHSGLPLDCHWIVTDSG